MNLFDRLQTGLSRAPESLTRPYFSDMRANGMDEATFHDAAVLIAITDRPKPGVILTQRPQWLNRHAGQVAFPGGRVDPGDRSAEDAALREAEEEITLAREFVSVAGRSVRFFSGSGFRITPIIGVIPPDVPLLPNPQEVEHIFEAPLALLLDPDNFVQRTGEWNGKTRQYHELHWGGFHIWGITAAILLNLSLHLDGAIEGLTPANVYVDDKE